MTNQPDNSHSAKPRLAVIIVNYNSCSDTIRCLESLFSNPLETASLEVLVVDNASTDNSVVVLRQRFPQLHIIANSENIGFARAVNQGLKNLSPADYYLLLNPDTIIPVNPHLTPSHPLDFMVEFLRQHPEAGAVGCRLLLADGTPQISTGRFPSPLSYLTDHSLLHPLRIFWRRFMRKHRGRTPHPPPKPLAQEVDWLMGACLLLPANILREIGYLDEQFFMYAEDADLCYRIRQSGKKIYYLPDVFIYHFHKGTSRKFLQFTFVQLFRSLLLYHSKHSSPLNRLTVRMFMFVDMIIRFLIYGFLWLITLGRKPELIQRLKATLQVMGLVTTVTKEEKQN